ncbi:MAG: tRNA (adenosine(37)-N6)-dimethylallyltransferase MiaA [Clostridia bacterium]
MKDVIVVTGPTASGKTSVAVELAKRLGTQVVSADSMQVYRGMDIGTAKPDAQERQGVIHHLVDIVQPDEPFSVADYQMHARAILRQMTEAGMIPVIAGGTGLYIEALLHDLDFSEKGIDRDRRMHYEEIYREKGANHLHGILTERDEEAAKAIHPNNKKRIIRALEILDEFHGTLGDYQKNALGKSPYDFHLFILNPDRKFLYESIEKRVDDMLCKGLVDEVRVLTGRYPGKGMTSFQAIGYKETAAYLRGTSTEEEMVRLLKRNTRRYAKRQLTWLRRYREGTWLETDETTSPAMLTEKILQTLGKNGIIISHEISE